MNTMQQAADELRRFAVRLKAVMALADEMDRLGSIDQAVIEAEGRLSVVNASADVAREQYDKAAAGILTANTEAETILARAKQDAEEIARQAMASAEAVSREAEGRARGIEAAAEARSKTVDEATGAAERNLESLLEKIAAKQAEFDRVQAAHADFRRNVGLA